MCCISFNSERILATHWRRVHIGVSPIENYSQITFLMSLFNQCPNYKCGLLLDNRDRLCRDIFIANNAEYTVFYNRHQCGFESLANTLRLFLRDQNMHCLSFLMQLFEAPTQTTDPTPAHTPNSSTSPPGDSGRELQPEDVPLENSRLPNTW